MQVLVHGPLLEADHHNTLTVAAHDQTQSACPERGHRTAAHGVLKIGDEAQVVVGGVGGPTVLGRQTIQSVARRIRANGVRVGVADKLDLETLDLTSTDLQAPQREPHALLASPVLNKGVVRSGVQLVAGM